MAPEVFRFVVRPSKPNDPRSAGFLAGAHSLGLAGISHLECHDLYFIEGRLEEPQLRRIATALLSDPITQIAEWGRPFNNPVSPGEDDRRVVEVALRPGVTDPIAAQLVRAASVLGIVGVERASTGLRFVLSGRGLDDHTLDLLARRLLANAVIQRYALGEVEPVFPSPAQATAQVEWIILQGLSDSQLLSVSQVRRAALDLDEMRALQRYFSAEGRDPTDVEFEMLAQTWSEHCVHKTFKARIEVRAGVGAVGARLPAQGDGTAAPAQTTVDGLLDTYIRAATDQVAAAWVRSAFQDNAGIIAFDEDHDISFKVETHNHPSAIEPFGGANTGVGGVIRDILGVSAKPIAATDVLCFGPLDSPFENLPEGVLHPRRIQSGVVAGVQDYGNKIGIPTLNGAILYDEGFTANPLVFCGCLGIAPRNSHPRAPQPGDRVIVLGGRTGRDGLRGATFSSMTMDAQTGEVSGASVQIGDPITEKGLIEVITRARDQILYHAVTDCGAGGLSSAVGEMASSTGAEVELDQVRLKYPGLAPWEIWLSEAQERMVLAVPQSGMPELMRLCSTFDVELTDIGAFTATGRLVVRYNREVILDLANGFLHGGIPRRSLRAVVESRDPVGASLSSPRPPARMSFSSSLLGLLAHPNIASKEYVVRIYDHEVLGGTVVKPATGAENDGPSDACVLKPAGTHSNRAVVLSNGINPQYGKKNAYCMAVSAVDEAIRNAVAVGADPERIALLDNFCWGDPQREETLGSLVEAARGCYEAALHYRAPFISGKDSLNNEYLGADGQRHAIPPTLLISAVGTIDDLNQVVTMDLKRPGDVIYLVGRAQPSFGGSHYAILHAWEDSGEPPGIPPEAPGVYAALHQAIQTGLMVACHDLSEGGLAVAAAEMCIGGRLGMELALDTNDPEAALFAETNGCLLVEVPPHSRAAFEATFKGLPCQPIGEVSTASRFSVSNRHQVLISLLLEDLVRSWKTVP